MTNNKLLLAIIGVIAVVVIAGNQLVYARTYELGSPFKTQLEECVKVKSDYISSERLCQSLAQIVVKGFVNEFCKRYGDEGINVLVDKGMLRTNYRFVPCSEMLK